MCDKRVTRTVITKDLEVLTILTCFMYPLHILSVAQWWDSYVL